MTPEMNKCHFIIPKPEKREKGRTWKTSDPKDKQNETEPTSAEGEQWDWYCKSQGRRIPGKTKGWKRLNALEPREEENLSIEGHFYLQ